MIEESEELKDLYDLEISNSFEDDSEFRIGDLPIKLVFKKHLVFPIIFSFFLLCMLLVMSSSLSPDTYEYKFEGERYPKYIINATFNNIHYSKNGLYFAIKMKQISQEKIQNLIKSKYNVHDYDFDSYNFTGNFSIQCYLKNKELKHRFYQNFSHLFIYSQNTGFSDSFIIYSDKLIDYHSIHLEIHVKAPNIHPESFILEFYSTPILFVFFEILLKISFLAYSSPLLYYFYKKFTKLYQKEDLLCIMCNFFLLLNSNLLSYFPLIHSFFPIFQKCLVILDLIFRDLYFTFSLFFIVVIFCNLLQSKYNEPNNGQNNELFLSFNKCFLTYLIFIPLAINLFIDDFNLFYLESKDFSHSFYCPYSVLTISHTVFFGAYLIIFFYLLYDFKGKLNVIILNRAINYSVISGTINIMMILLYIVRLFFSIDQLYLTLILFFSTLSMNILHISTNHEDKSLKSKEKEIYLKVNAINM
ncbi:hypothetical protein TRFO_18718 [Tritrichomonas foetus]|uniref:Uncharacterized protein n=1 Tax=Tritrichomonas foetus TaxID=1144522 RepID=A0A1J4KQL5_9EUKA|nr:hypothetical protein TRFO_18718 [Tritrichomonas foetus]|eukprot:OHT11741.1 hypothetical protein TRFO_18718 [Tritrichomonas foetus]